MDKKNYVVLLFEELLLLILIKIEYLNPDNLNNAS